MQKQSLVDSLSVILESETNQILSKSILNTIDANTISEMISTFCQEKLGSPVGACLYVGFSVGASFGLSLLDGRDIFLKVNKPTNKDDINVISLDSLTTISKIQRHLSKNGFPCPKVILDPIDIGIGIVTTNSYEDIGEQKDAHNPSIGMQWQQRFTNLLKVLILIKNKLDLTRERCGPAPHFIQNRTTRYLILKNQLKVLNG
ncbi:hypothetical protein DRW41_00385 [Neobacillus piezotolerans]|uniref:Aminoglycoside phosphotransferase domain-containing protein n=2 Tax=Neobacillus piezotolerans TaxID=2259171 RepID=A0A3D8GUE0_9BACI|nr:hypothetical protein DRW41_00385 [Neobacillus piezotolerans]